MPLLKSVSTILSELYSQTNRAVMPQNDTIVATASNTIQRTPKVEPAGVRRVAFASKLFTLYLYEKAIKEIRWKEDCFEEIPIKKRARQRKVARSRPLALRCQTHGVSFLSLSFGNLSLTILILTF